jgi:hypothetical protein
VVTGLSRPAEAKEENDDLAAIRDFDASLARGEEELIPRAVKAVGSMPPAGKG